MRTRLKLRTRKLVAQNRVQLLSVRSKHVTRWHQYVQGKTFVNKNIFVANASDDEVIRSQNSTSDMRFSVINHLIPADFSIMGEHFRPISLTPTRLQRTLTPHILITNPSSKTGFNRYTNSPTPFSSKKSILKGHLNHIIFHTNGRVPFLNVKKLVNIFFIICSGKKERPTFIQKPYSTLLTKLTEYFPYSTRLREFESLVRASRKGTILNLAASDLFESYLQGYNQQFIIIARLFPTGWLGFPVKRRAPEFQLHFPSFHPTPIASNSI